MHKIAHKKLSINLGEILKQKCAIMFKTTDKKQIVNLADGYKLKCVKH